MNIFVCDVSTTMQNILGIIYCPLTSQGRGHCNLLTIWGYIVSNYLRMGPIPCKIGCAIHNPTYCVTITFQKSSCCKNFEWVPLWTLTITGKYLVQYCPHASQFRGHGDFFTTMRGYVVSTSACMHFMEPMAWASWLANGDQLVEKTPA